METATTDATTQRFLGQWKRLVSTTNWDKGRIICAWRQALEERGAPAAEYSDEAWSREVGHVTPQHVGRLRRTWERFGTVANDYDGLYWSHFQAATDWHDAEMWLEGAVQNGWAVQHMRGERATTLGLVDAQGLPEEDAAAPWDDDAETPAADARSALREAVVQDPGAARGTNSGEPADEAQDASRGDSWETDGEARADADPTPMAESRRPFAELPSLPADVSDAFESFKLCILRHKLAGWTDLSRDDMLVALDALKELALARTDD